MSDEQFVTPDFLASGRLEAIIRELGIHLIGTSIGVYHITELLGAGGMGEVYRATDTRLHRDVAIKVLPDRFVRDGQRLARFTREAQTLASLNHPNIAQIYGLEESNGVRALVMELVEGEDLSQYIARGPIPIDEALPIAKQIAEALEAAHEQGIIHRDLKPANIKVTPDRAVKVLDFGLAKLAHIGATAGPFDVNASPTITSPAMMTGVGALLGTPAYMSPEQAKGREADRRSDIWAFGCLLYEMLTGKRPFDGEDVSDTLANVLKIDPDWSALPSEISPAIRTLLQSCLTKDRRRRVADISTALFVLDKGANLAPPGGIASAPLLRRRPLWRRIAAVTLFALMVAAVGAALMWVATRPALQRIVRTTIVTSGSTALVLYPGGDRDIAITPDGSRIVYRGNNQLLVRKLDQLEPTLLSGLGAPRGIFISPDGQWVGFSDGIIGLKKVAIGGGSPVMIVPEGVLRGATWGQDGTIIFATSAVASGLQRVSDGGGEITVLTKPNRERGELDHLWPELLPGGNAVLYTITAAGGIDNAQIAVLDLRTNTSKVLPVKGSHAQYVPTGHLIYGYTGTLRAVPFDLKRLEVIGTPAPVLQGVVTTNFGAANVAVAANGSLVYVPGSAQIPKSVVSVDREGNVSPLPNIPSDNYRYVRVSPDGARLALGNQNDVWIYDVVRVRMTRLTDHLALDMSPLWTRDSQRIIFTSDRAGYRELFVRSANGTGPETRVLTRANDLVDLMANGWSADGAQLLFSEVSSRAKVVGTIGQMAFEPPSDVRLLVNTGNNNGRAAVSPSGRLIAYESDLSGQPEIYVDRYPELGNRQTISSGGGRLPVWSRNGGELFFSTPDARQMLAVPVQSATTFGEGRPKELFKFAMLSNSGANRPYDITKDGRFFIIRRDPAQDGDGAPSNLILVQNWTEELKRLVPTK
jgi:eukaryotic-like serine/threonine-protein kinase